MIFALPGVAEFTDETTTRKDPVGYADEVRALIADLAERNAFLWFDIKPSLLHFADKTNVNVASLYGSPDRHFTEVGYYAASRIIAQEIQDRSKDSMDIDEIFVNLTTFDPRNISCPEMVMEAK